MKKIRVVFETEDKKIGYLIDPDNQRVISGTFDDAGRHIVEISQEGAINNPDEICKQIYYVLLAGVKSS